MKECLLVCLIFVININLIASIFVCRFIDNSQESIELSCDDREQIHWANDGYTSIIFNGSSQISDAISVRSIKVGSCHREFQENGKHLVKQFENIEKIDVSTVNIRDDDISLFSYIWRFDHLKCLNASHNELMELPKIQTNVLNEIDFSHNNISYSSTWQHFLASLMTINLSHNRISNLPDDTFLLAKDLQYLDLSYNQITKMSPFYFKNCPKLRILHLQHNEIIAFRGDHWIPGIEPKLPYDLEILNLEDNRLTNLDPIGPLKFVKNATIGLQNNRLSCEYLHRFVDQRHDLTFMGNIWKQANNSTDVDCQKDLERSTISPIVKANDDKINPPNLRVIFREIPNRYTTASDDTINATKPHTIIREIQPTAVAIDKTSNEHTTTEVAKIGIDNHTETVVQIKLNEQHSNYFENETIIKSHLKYLSNFNISGNRLNNTIEIIQHLGEPLESLDVSLNFIGVLRNGSFSVFVNLQYLNLSRTNLSIIESNTFRHLSKLKSLDLSYNYLDNVKFILALGWSNELETLILNGNRLTSMYDTYLISEQFPNLSTFEYIRDQFSCEDISKEVEDVFESISEELDERTATSLNAKLILVKLICAFNQLLLSFDPNSSIENSPS